MLRFFSRVTFIQKRYSSILTNLVDKCRSCGIPLQLANQKIPGFVPISKHKPFKKYEDSVYQKHLQLLDAETLNLLGVSPEPNPRPSKPASQEPENQECLRCRRIKYQSSTDVPGKQVDSQEIQEKIDQINGQMVYIANGVDFPAGLNVQLLKTYKPIVVITRADLMFHSQETVPKFPFFKQYLKQKFDIPPERVFVISNHKRWGIPQLHNYLSKLPQTYFMVGDVNSGKSTTVSKLMFHEHGDFRKKFQLWSKDNGPGISDLPGFTQDINEFDLSSYNLVDLPGYNHIDIPNFGDFKTVLKGSKIYKNGAYDSPYFTIKKQQILTVGGLFYLKPPKESIVQIKNMINFKPYVMSDLDKLSKHEANLDPAMKNKFIIPPTTKLKTLVVPPFIGKVDLVIKNIGYIELKVTGSKQSNELFELLVPEQYNFEFVIRRPIINYIAKSLSGRDKKGNLLRKENVWKSTKVTKPYTGEKFLSGLYPKKIDQNNSVQLATGLNYGDNTEIDAKNCYDYWIE